MNGMPFGHRQAKYDLALFSYLQLPASMMRDALDTVAVLRRV